MSCLGFDRRRSKSVAGDSDSDSGDGPPATPDSKRSSKEPAMAPTPGTAGRVLEHSETPPASPVIKHGDGPRHRRTSSTPPSRGLALLGGSSSDLGGGQRTSTRDGQSCARDGRVGLENMGNTCFMNSALQCLSHTSDLTDFFLNTPWHSEINESNPLGTGGALARAYEKLLRQLWQEGPSSVRPAEVKKVVSKVAPQFGGYHQHDAQELAAFLLDGLHEDLNRVGKKPYIEDVEVKEGGPPEEQVAAEAWGNYLRRDRSVVVDTFQGQLKSSVRCKECGFVTAKFDPFMYLSLPLPTSNNGELTLDDCLKEFVKEEELDPDNLWRCPRCKDFRPATKTFQLWKPPPHLVVHLKRFRTDAYGRHAAKRNDLVQAPLGPLDLTQYFSSSACAAPPRYDLYAVCNHSGSISFGHYTAMARHCRDGQWHLYNDARCSAVDPQRVVSPDNYLLFFRQLNPAKPRRQSLSEPENWPFRLSTIPDKFKAAMAEARGEGAAAGAGAGSPATPKPGSSSQARRVRRGSGSAQRGGGGDEGGEASPAGSVASSSLSFEMSESPARH